MLVLLPIHGHPLQVRYSRPFVVEKQVNDADYIIKTLGHCKDSRLCHINMLKPYQEREATAESKCQTVPAKYSTVQHRNSATPQQCNTATVQHRNSATPQQCNTATVQCHNTATPLQCNTTKLQNVKVIMRDAVRL